jgi:hypothetical protein
MVNEQKAREDIRRGFEIYNTLDPDAMDRWYDEFLTPDATYHNPGVRDLAPGREGVKQFVRRLYKAIPGMYHNPAEDVIVQGDRIAVRYAVSRTDPASGRRLTAMILMINHYVGDRVAETWEIVGPWEEQVE